MTGVVWLTVNDSFSLHMKVAKLALKATIQIYKMYFIAILQSVSASNWGKWYVADEGQF